MFDDGDDDDLKTGCFCLLDPERSSQFDSMVENLFFFPVSSFLG